MNSYLQSLAQVFAQEVGSDLSKYIFVFPNHRAGLFFRKYLCKALPQPIFAPKVITINECFASFTDLRVADQLTLLLRLYKLYAQCRTNAEPLEQFLHWGKMMLSDFSEIDNHLVKDVKSLYALVEDMRDIDVHFASLSPKQIDAIKSFWKEFHQSSTNNGGGVMHEQFIRTWQLLYPLYTRLQESLLADQLAYEGLLHRQVIEHWDEIKEDQLGVQYVFIGFNAMTESERQLMLKLQQMDRADFYFDYSDQILQDPHNSASRFMQDNQLLFRSRYQVPSQGTGLALQDKQISLITVSSSVSQTHQVHEVLSQIKDTISDWTRTAVVLPNEELLIPLLHTIPSEIEKVNVTMGYPLRATSSYKLLAYPEQPLPEHYEEFIDNIRQELHQNRNNNNSESIYQMLKIVDRVEQAICNHPDITFSVEAVQQLLKMLTLELTIPYTGEPLEGLQIMGVLETRALEFDNIIITDFNDDLYPGHTRNNSFIPYTLRRGFDLPTIERQDAIFAYNFYRMLSHAKKIWFIANTHADDQHSGELSRYYYQLLWQYQIPIEHIIISDKLQSNTYDRLPIAKTEKILDSLSEFYASSSRQRHLSATALGEYLRCQKSFYYKYIENIHDKDVDESVSISNMTFGEVYHEIMQHLYTPYEGKLVHENDITTLKQDVYNDQYWAQLKPLEKLLGDEWAEKVIRNCVYTTLEHDLTLVPFEYYKSELGTSRTLHIPSLQQDLSFFGKIDRVDVKSNHMRVIDYKTGSATLDFTSMREIFGRSKNIEETEVVMRNEGNKYILQTLLYCWLLEKDKRVEALQEKHAHSLNMAPGIYSVRQLHDESKPTYLHRKEEEILYTADIAQEFVGELTELIEEIYNPDIPFYPAQDNRKCDGCYLSEICLLPQKKEDA